MTDVSMVQGPFTVPIDETSAVFKRGTLATNLSTGLIRACDEISVATLVRSVYA